MPSPLAATLRSKDTKKNRTVPGDTILFVFSALPPEANDVSIDIQQGQFKEASGEVTPGAVLATFKGQVRNSKYVPGTASAFRRRRSVEDMLMKVTDGKSTTEIGLLDPEPMVLRNELQITVRGTVAGKAGFFQGKAAMFVDYPLAMIVPTENGRRDPALGMIAKWAEQWRTKDKDLRHVHSVEPLAPPQKPLPAHYNPLIAALQAAAQSAPGGIVALAIGHGDGGVGAGLSVAWCDLMPENVKPIENPDGSTSYPHTLFANKTNLLFGHIRGNTPGSRDRLILNAIDRIGDALNEAPIAIRKLLLHTCNVGNDKTIPGERPGDPEIPGFTQLIAYRTQLRVQAHTDFIVYNRHGQSAGRDASRGKVGGDGVAAEFGFGGVDSRSGPGSHTLRSVMRHFLYSVLVGGAVLACRPAPARVASAASQPQPVTAWSASNLTTEWTRTFTPSAKRGVCPCPLSTDADGSIFMVGLVEGEQKLDEMQLEANDEALYLARLAPRGEPEWAVALPPERTRRWEPHVTQLALFGDHVFLAGGGMYGADSRFVYTKSGKPISTRRLADTEVSFALLLDATSWVVNQRTVDWRRVLRYQDERGNTWQREYSSHHSAAMAGSSDGRIASAGDLDPKRAGTESNDRVSVLAKETGKVLFTTPLPRVAERTEALATKGADAWVQKLAFDAKRRLWVSGSAPTDERPFVLVVGTQGEQVAELSVDGAGSRITDGPVLLPDGRAVLALKADRMITLQSSFAGSAKFGPGETLIELDIDGKRATFRKAPARTACLTPTSDGGLLGCVQHFVKLGTASWPARCDLVKWKLPAPSEGGAP